MFKFYFVEKRMYVMKNKFNQINKEIILCSQKYKPEKIMYIIASYCFIDDGS